MIHLFILSLSDFEVLLYENQLQDKYNEVLIHYDLENTYYIVFISIKSKMEHLENTSSETNE